MKKSFVFVLLLLVIVAGCAQKQQVSDTNQLSNQPKDTPNVAQSKGISDCSTLEIPKNVERNTNLDKENGILEVSWFDNSQGKDVTYKIRYTDKNCSESIKQLISHVLETEKNNK